MHFSQLKQDAAITVTGKYGVRIKQVTFLNLLKSGKK